MMQQTNSFGSRMGQFGFDVTSNVELRMVNSAINDLETRGPHAPNLECAAAERLLISFRDEAIWQYYVRCVRGFLFWATDRLISYVPDRPAGNRIVHEPSLGRIHLAKLLDRYDPTSEAIVWSEHENGDELFRISSDGGREEIYHTGVVAVTVC